MLTTHQVKRERACPGTRMVRLAHDDVADAAYAAENVGFQQLIVFEVWH